MNQANATKQTQYASDKAAYDNGYLVLYAGTVPATADTTLGAQTAVATLRYGTTAFAAGSNGSGTNNAMTSDTNAAGGTVAFARSFTATGVSQANVIAQHTVTATGGGGDLTLASLAIAAGSTVTGGSGVLTLTQG